jgi:S-adenosylmethionine:tRNA ribosyltransferase-isomerase
MLKLSDFDYHLPKELIAQEPLEKRDSCRLMIVDRKKQTITHGVFSDIVSYFQPGDVLVLNNTKVLTCRLFGTRSSGGKVEIFLLAHKRDLVFEAMIKPGRIRLDEKITFPGTDISCTRIGKDEVVFSSGSVADIYRLGYIPLPPYIKRMPSDIDTTHYQTVYAAHDGSVASPTAGLHFTPELLSLLAEKDVLIAPVTLHVGKATFTPVSSEDITQHVMGQETFSVPETSAVMIRSAKKEGRRVIAVGTTSCRTLETFARDASHGTTGLYLYPGCDFKIVDGLVTNFHLPRTSLFILVCALAGTTLARSAYDIAVSQGYRFYSYGDAMLIV